MQMDSQGYVSIPLVATFNRIKNLTTDLTLVREMLALSQLVEVKGDKVRLAKQGWAQWVLPGATEAAYEVKMPEQEQTPVTGEKERPVAVEEKESVIEETQDEQDEREVEEATLSI
jgi:la-related protein 1